jgi:hypothetical protein
MPGGILVGMIQAGCCPEHGRRRTSVIVGIDGRNEMSASHLELILSNELAVICDITYSLRAAIRG